MFARFLTILALFAGSPAFAAGFEFAEVPVSGDAPPIEIAIWYPTEASSPERANTPFGQAVAMNAAISGRDLPLVVISHGDGGWFGSHASLAAALADAGMIAAALNHPGNSDGDEGTSPAEWIVDRPGHLARVVSFMTGQWAGASHVGADRLGAFGFSAGGHTVLAAAGALPSRERISAHCEAVPEEFVCRVGMAAEVVRGVGVFPPPIPNLRAVVAAAPGFGFSFDPAQVAALNTTIQLWSGALDDRVPHETNAAPLAKSLAPPSESHLVPSAGHFAFRAPCDPALETANPRVWAMACVDAPGFDRQAFQARFTADVVSFFSRNLGGG